MVDIKKINHYSEKGLVSKESLLPYEDLEKIRFSFSKTFWTNKCVDKKLH